MNNINKYVIKVENKQPVNHPITYSNFLQVFPTCPVQNIPTNDVIGRYGYEVFVVKQPPTSSRFEHPAVLSKYINVNNVWTHEWELPPFTEEEKQEKIQMELNMFRQVCITRLESTDWTQSDTSLSEQEKAAWASYRDQLNNLLEQTTDPFGIKWPVPPKPLIPPRPQ